MPSVWPSLLAFAVVVAAIPFALSLLKRAQQLRPSRQGPLNLVAGLAVGPRERIAIVEASGQWLVIGVTAQAISLLAKLDGPPAATSGAPAPSDSASQAFAQLLSSFRNKD